MKTNLALRLKGLLLLGLCLGLIGLSIAFYSKSFSNTIDVVVEADRAGLQLNPNADVRVRGALVGRLESLEVVGSAARLHLAIDPDKAEQIPATVAARILPTTLFGQKYVELVPLKGGSGEGLTAGTVVPIDRSETAVELNETIDALEDVLTAVRPQDLSATLTAVATGFEGRGDRFGANATSAVAYFRALNEHLPQLVRDLRLFSRATGVFYRITPDTLTTLDNSTTTAGTISDLDEELATSFRELTLLADQARAFFEANGIRLEQALESGRPVLLLFERYSPQTVCMVRGLARTRDLASKVIRGHKLMLSDSLGKELAGYTGDDRPILGNVGKGPECYDLPMSKGLIVHPPSNTGATLEPLFPGVS